MVSSSLAEHGRGSKGNIALQWQDIDYQSRCIQVRQSYSRGKITTPKNGESRRVDMSQELTLALKGLYAERQREAAVNGWSELPVWVFCDRGQGSVSQYPSAGLLSTHEGRWSEEDSLPRPSTYLRILAAATRRKRLLREGATGSCVRSNHHRLLWAFGSGIE
jgi:integrase